MSAGAWFMLVLAEATIAAFTAYFFWKAVKTPPKPGPGSYSDNNSVKP